MDLKGNFFMIGSIITIWGTGEEKATGESNKVEYGSVYVKVKVP